MDSSLPVSIVLHLHNVSHPVGLWETHGKTACRQVHIPTSVLAAGLSVLVAYYVVNWTVPSLPPNVSIQVPLEQNLRAFWLREAIGDSWLCVRIHRVSSLERGSMSPVSR